MSNKDLQVLITGDATGLFKSLGEASMAMKTMATEIEGTVGGLRALFSNLAAPLMAITAVVGGMEFLKGTVEATKDWTMEANKLARVLGITTEQASVLNVAIGDIHGNIDDYLAAAGKMIKTLGTNEEAFKRLGVATRDSNGRFRDAPSIMADVSAKLNEIKSGTDRGVAASQIFGKSWKEMLLYLQLTPEAMTEAKEKAEKLNLIVGQDAVTAAKNYRKSVVDLNDTFKALKIRLGTELMPLMTEWNKDMAEHGPAAVSIFGNAISGIYQVFLGLRETVAGGLIGMNLFWDLAVESAKVASEQLKALAHGDLDEVARLKACYGDFEQARTQLAKHDLESIKDYYTEKMQIVMGLGQKKTETPVADGKGAPDTKADQDKEYERLKAALEKQKAAFENAKTAQGDFQVWSSAQTATYWRTVLQTQDLSEKTRAKAQQEYSKARQEVLKQSNAESHALEASWRERDKAEQIGDLDDQLAKVEFALRRGLIDEQQALDEKKRIEQEKYQVELGYLQAGLAAAKNNPVERAKINGEIEALERQHGARMRDLRFQQADFDRQKDGWAGWAEGIRESLKAAQNSFEIFKQAATQILSGVTNAFATGIQGILSGQMTLKDGIKAVWSGIVQTITQAVAQMIAQWLVAQIAQKVFGKVSAATALSTAAAETSASLTAGAAEAWAAYGWMPFVGAGLAVAQIAAMEASVAAVGAASAFGAGVFLAEGGRIDKPTLALMGEAGPELVAPEKNFLDWAGNLEANILARQGVVAGYGQQSAGFASAGKGSGGQGVQQLHVHMDGATILDSSQRGLRQLGHMVIDGARTAAREMGVVLVPGQVFQGL